MWREVGGIVPLFMGEIHEQRGKVQRPDAQDTSHVEGAETDGSGGLLLAIEKLGDEESAEEEEQAEPERTAGSHLRQPAAWEQRRVEDKDREEG